MKDYLAELVRSALTPAHARNLAREYLQARLLGALQRAGAMIPLAFQGGTALRFLYFAPRYSEDLDFALERQPESYDFRAYLHAIRRELTDEGYTVMIKVSDQRVVHSAFVRLPGLLYELGLSPHHDETLSIKLEVDTRPPSGAGLNTTLIRRHIPLHIQHHDRPSLLAGKVHAILQRSYSKGRDWYDLLWYLSDPDWPPPNLILLNNALMQTGWKDAPLTESTWRSAVRQRLLDLKWERIIEDVRPFLEPTADLNLLTRENLISLLGG